MKYSFIYYLLIICFKNPIYCSINEFLDKLGSEPLDKKYENLVKEVMYDLKMQDYNINIFKMNNYAIELFGKNNSFVIKNNLYLSEYLLNNLSYNGKRALIGHELMHIKKDHQLKKILHHIIMDIISMIIILNTKSNSKNNSDDPENIFNYINKYKNETLLTFIIFKFLYIFKLSREYETEADILSAKELNNPDGAIELLKYLNGYYNNDNKNSNYIINSILEFIKIPLNKIFSLFKTHPAIKKRIRNMEKLKLELKYKKN